VIAPFWAITHLSALLTDRGIPAERAAIASRPNDTSGAKKRSISQPVASRPARAAPPIADTAMAALGTFLLSSASSLPAGVLAAVLIGFSMGGEADVIPYLVARYFGLRSFSVLYALTWTAYAIAGAIGPVLMGKAFDATGSYVTLLVWLAGGTLVIAPLMLLLPRYATAEPVSHA